MAEVPSGGEYLQSLDNGKTWRVIDANGKVIDGKEVKKGKDGSLEIVDAKPTKAN